VPEGDTIFRAASHLDRALAGREVLRFETVFPKLASLDEAQPLKGRQILSVSARGKWVLIHFSQDLVLLTHLRMQGSWHIYHPGRRWKRGRSHARIVIETGGAVAVGFDVPVAEFVEQKRLDRHPVLARLGPDPLGRHFDLGEVLRRSRAQPGISIGRLLLDQGVLAGVGNVLKSETLFRAAVHPATLVKDLSQDRLERVISAAEDLLHVNTLDARRLGEGVPLALRSGSRRGAGGADPSALYVYGRKGKPCRRCGTPIEAFREDRVSYFCPSCQGVSGGEP
jgi:endonuclease-8